MTRDVKSFLKIKRAAADYRPVCQRLGDWQQVIVEREIGQSQEQASRCMDCGTPFCHGGCPLGNYIPEWNDFAARGHWDKAFALLDVSNDLPEITGRVCPAPCEYACVLGLNDDAVTIRENELAIVERAFESGYIKACPPRIRTGKKTAVIGSGPAGLACAIQLNRLGHGVTVFERDQRIGGIMRYGIPDFKLEKQLLDRRLNIWKQEGLEFITGADIRTAEQLKNFDAVILACGARQPRDLAIPGRQLSGIHFAMDYLTQSNRRVSGDKIDPDRLIDAKGKKVVVIGGGDTGADCLGTAHRQKASCVVQIEVMPQPPQCRDAAQPWPRYPMLLKMSTSHQEGGERQWAVLTKKFLGDKGKVKKLSCVRVEFAQVPAQACPVMREIKGSDFEIEADLVLLAVGFLHAEHNGLVKELGLELDSRGNIKTKDYQTSRPKIFSCGDMRTGQSLVVKAMADARVCARSVSRAI